MRDSILRKARESAELQARFFEEHADALETCARTLAGIFREGGRLFVMGNGGSGCDAQHAAVEFQHPIVEKRRPLPASVLGSQIALLTAVANDNDFSRAYAVELELHARKGDALLGISTSGASANVNRALRRGRELSLLTIGFSGRDGGPMVDLCQTCFVVPSWSIHRIQETHTVLLHLLWDSVQVALGEDDVL